jgi:hypothetical protein
MAAIGLVGTAGVGLLTAAVVRGHPAGRPPKVAPTLQVPGGLPPALAGALVAGHVRTEQHVATVLDLAGRGALAFEPAPSRKKGEVQLLLVDHSIPRPGYEREVWNALAGLAEHEVVGQKAIGKLSGRLGPAGASITGEMEARGWWDRALLRRRTPLIWGGVAAVAIAAVGIITAIVGEEPLGLIGALPLAAAGTIALVVAAVFSQTTAAGQAQAAPWRALQAGLKAARRDEAAVLDFDAALPYAVALGAAGALDRQLKAASAEGRVPLAFRQGVQGDAWAGGFYPYWIGFSASSGASGDGGAGAAGVSAGGAAAGGAGAGGST